MLPEDSLSQHQLRLPSRSESILLHLYHQDPPTSSAYFLSFSSRWTGSPERLAAYQKLNFDCLCSGIATCLLRHQYSLVAQYYPASTLTSALRYRIGQSHRFRCSIAPRSPLTNVCCCLSYSNSWASVR